MATHLTVPGDVEPTSVIDLVNDCRELVGAVSSLGVTTAGALAGFARVPLSRVPRMRGAAPVEISSGTATALDGYGDYGS